MKASPRLSIEPPPALHQAPIRKLFEDATLQFPDTDIVIQQIQAYTYQQERCIRNIYRVSLGIGNRSFGITIEVTNNKTDQYKLWAVSGPDSLRKRMRHITQESFNSSLDSKTTPEIIAALLTTAKTQESFVQMAVREESSHVLKVGAFAFLACAASLVAIIIANEGTSRASLRHSAAALTANFNVPAKPKTLTVDAGIDR